DTQPALRPLNVSVRGGRLTKFKGQVASIAPGLSAMATAAVLFTGGAAQAANECGEEARGPNDSDIRQDTVTCGAGTYSNGITYIGSDGLTLILDDVNVTNGTRTFGVFVKGRSGDGPHLGDDIVVEMKDGKVDTAGANAMAIFADIENPASNANVTVNVKEGAEIVTNGKSAHGVLASNKGGGDAHVVMEGVETKIAINGAKVDDFDSTYGLWANVRQFRGEGGDGNATAEMKGGEITIEKRDAHAVYAAIENRNNGKTATARMIDGSISTKAHRGYGLFAETHGTGKAVAEILGGSITTNTDDDGGNNAYGLWAYLEGTTSREAQATVRMDQENGNVETSVTTSGDSSFGIVASTTTLGHVRGEMDRGKIATSGAFAHGTFAWIYGKDNDETATVEMTGGEVITTGDNAYGIVAAISDVSGLTRAIESTATATALMTGGEVFTTGDNAYGIVASSSGLGAVSAEMKGGDVTTRGEGARGLAAQIFNMESTATATALMTRGEIGTENDNAHGISAANNGLGDAIAEMRVHGAVTTRGTEAHGVYTGAARGQAIVNLGVHADVTAYGARADGIRAAGATGFDVDVAGDVTGGTGGGAAIRTISSAGGTIDIASTARVNAEEFGLAIQDGAGDVVITSAGAVTGVAHLGAGNNTLKLLSGSSSSFTGDVYTGAGNDTLELAGGHFTGVAHLGAGNNALTLTSGSFTGDVYTRAGNDTLELAGGRFEGNIYTGAGNDTVSISAATIYGPYILDGGAGGDDQLTFSGPMTMTATAGHLRNWERITLDTDLSIDSTSEFRVSGGIGDTPTEITIRGDVTNEGRAVFSVQDGDAGDVIRVEGDYTGSGTSLFALDARMDGTDTDILHFTGDVSGDMEVLIASVGNAGATGGPLEIYVVSVDGEADDATFTLMNGNYVMSDGEHGVISGAYVYRLAEVETQDGSNWWALSARSESGEISWGPSAPIYDSYGASLLAFNAPSGLHARGSSQDFRTLAWSGQAAQTNGSPLWVQMGTEQITSAAEQSTTGAARDSSLWEMEIGADIVLDTSTAGLLVGGLMLSYGTGSTDVSSDFGDGSIETTGLGLGLAATWYDRRGFYVDGQVTVSSYTSDLTADRLGSLTEGNSGTGFALSIEAGQQLDFGARLTVIPQAQLSLSSVTFSDFANEARGERVTLEDASSQQLRLGLEFGAQDQGASGVYGMVNLYHDFGSGSEVRVGPASLTSENEAWALGFGIGGSYAWNDRVDLFGEASYATGLSNAGDVSALSASAGIKVMF
uniref:autotransporter outer membrane beta-barrel domain-containing protein n=1 Tax=uncultured Tateyamaria sp. TaxID=455651 RepID=UPI003419AD84